MNREKISASFILGCISLLITIQKIFEYSKTGQFYAPKGHDPISGFLAILIILSFLFFSISLLFYSLTKSIRYKKGEQKNSEGKSLELTKGSRLNKADMLKNILIALLLYFAAALIYKYL